MSEEDEVDGEGLQGLSDDASETSEEEVEPVPPSALLTILELHACGTAESTEEGEEESHWDGIEEMLVAV